MWMAVFQCAKTNPFRGNEFGGCLFFGVVTGETPQQDNGAAVVAIAPQNPLKVADSGKGNEEMKNPWRLCVVSSYSSSLSVVHSREFINSGFRLNPPIHRQTGRAKLKGGRSSLCCPLSWLHRRWIDDD